jgi:hypothetical protein
VDTSWISWYLDLLLPSNEKALLVGASYGQVINTSNTCGTTSSTSTLQTHQFRVRKTKFTARRSLTSAHDWQRSGAWHFAPCRSQPMTCQQCPGISHIASNLLDLQGSISLYSRSSPALCLGSPCARRQQRRTQPGLAPGQEHAFAYVSI